jgi:hypothetical protein
MDGLIVTLYNNEGFVPIIGPNYGEYIFCTAQEHTLFPGIVTYIDLSIKVSLPKGYILTLQLINSLIIRGLTIQGSIASLNEIKTLGVYIRNDSNVKYTFMKGQASMSGFVSKIKQPTLVVVNEYSLDEKSRIIKTE